MKIDRTIAALPVALALILLTTSVVIPQGHGAPSADVVSGQYNVAGTNPDGGQYSGTLEVIPRGSVYQFKWNAGTQYDGIGVRNGRIIAAAFANGSDGTGCGVVDYTIMGDGTLDGKWGYWGTSSAGTERAVRVNGRGGLDGEYTATGINTDGTRYQVKISVRTLAGGYRFVWSNNSEGFGIRRGNNVAIGIGGERCGFVAYDIKPGGTLDGIWGGYGGERTGTEIATKR
jgi:hypothetical protein